MPFGEDGALDLVLTRRARARIAREKDHPDAVLARLGQIDAEAFALAREELVRDLDEHARPVALERIGAGRPAVREIREDLEPLRDDFAALLALDVGDEAEAAGVVLVARIVESLGGRGRGGVHGRSYLASAGREKPG